MGLSYIPTSVEDIFNKYNTYYRDKGAEDITRNSVVTGRRTSDVAPEAISKFNTEYGLGASKGMADLSMTGATQAENEAMQFGGTSAFTGNNIQGALPFQAEQSNIQREFDKAQNEANWKAEQEMADKQAAASIWSGIFGGAGSLLGGFLSRK